MISKYKTLIRFAALIAASGMPASLYATPQQEAATTSHAGAEPAQASVPRLIQFNGTLKDATTHPVSGVASVTFAIYSEQDGGSPLWSETQNVLADALGHYNVLLGSATATGVPADLFGTGQSRWLGVTIARQEEMPRALMASVPYAMKAGDADTLGGLPASAYVTRNVNSHPIVAGNGSSVGNSPEAVLAPSSVIDATPTGSGTANFLPVWTSSTNLGTSKIFQANGGFVGINTTTPLLQLDVNGNSIFRGSFQMAPQGDATAGAGQPSHSFQWQGSVFNSSSGKAQNEAFGFRTVPNANNVSNPTAKLDLFYGPGGGTLNDINVAFTNTGRMGIGTANPNSQLEVSSSSPSNIENPSPNLTISNTGNTTDNTGSVSLDFNPFIASKTSPEARIEVEDDGESSATMYVQMKRPGSPSNPLDESFEIEDDGTIFFMKNVTFNSSVNIEGNLQKGSGTFRIDDPIDPANKYLSHSFVESPDMLDMYNGTATLDAKGEAEVTMPDWFNALNQSFQYQLTAVGAPGPGLFIKEKVHGNQFKIAGGAAGLEVSWQVTGVRHDAWANAHRTPVEEAKPEGEVGTYLHPELFGAGEDKRIASGKRPTPKKSADPVLAAPSTESNVASQQPGGKR